MILAGGSSLGLSVLSEVRTIPAVPFGGKYRVIDFPLSNAVNSGLYDVAVLTQYQPRSLNEHIGSGIPWDLDRMRGGIRLLQPYRARGDTDWYQGTAHAVFHAIDFIEETRAELVLVMMGDHVYKMDYGHLIRFHEEHNADATLATMPVPIEETRRFGIVTLDGHRVARFDEKPETNSSNIASMGVYLFKTQALLHCLGASESEAPRDFARDLLPRLVSGGATFAFPFHGYWQDIGTVESYWHANMDLIGDNPKLDLYDQNWVIHTRSEERAPARVTRLARMDDSFICHGCVVEGTVEQSVLSPGVYVGPGAVVRNAVVMTDTIIEAGAVVNHAIIDKRVRIGRESVIGYSSQVHDGATVQPGDEATRRWDVRSHPDIALVGREAQIPAGLRIGAGAVIGRMVRESDFEGREVPAGGRVGQPATLSRRNV
ncbi:MAG: glucose-1-phosphate adenylyltransferase [Chloroflexi bacterium]|nr:glucose-1-phosphate adenylyltransferase [Chloroflexota bacterium]